MSLTLLSGALAVEYSSPVVLQTIGGVDRALILGLLAVLVLPMITILFVSYLVDVETMDEDRLDRIEEAVVEIQDELGLDDEDETGSDQVATDGEGSGTVPTPGDSADGPSTSSDSADGSSTSSDSAAGSSTEDGGADVKSTGGDGRDDGVPPGNGDGMT